MKKKSTLYFMPLIGLLPLLLYCLFSLLQIHVGTTLEKQITCSDGSMYQVMVRGSLPIGCELSVSEVEESAYRESLGLNDEQVSSMEFLDISLLKDGVEMEPKEEVEVGIRRLNHQSVPGEVGRIYHFQEVETVELFPEETALASAPVPDGIPSRAQDTSLLEPSLSGTVMTVMEVASFEGDEVFFKTSSFSVFGVVYFITTKVLTSDGLTYRVTVTYDADAEIPEGAVLDVDEILDGEAYDSYVERAESALGMDEGSAQYIRLFDIKILKDGEKVQPAEGKTVDVKIQLEDTESQSLSVVHFKEDTEPELVESTTEASGEGQAVSFETDSFSVYAVVDAPEAYEPVARTVSSMEELQTFLEDENVTDKGFYLSVKNPKQYFSSSLNNKGCFIEVTDLAAAAVWYFEPVGGVADRYYIYTYVNGAKKYMKQKNGNEMKLDSTGTAFDIVDVLDTMGKPRGIFTIKHAGENRWLQHSNGGGGIRFYEACDNLNNTQITFTYASSVTIPFDPYGLDGQSWGIVYDSESLFCTALMGETPSAGTLNGEDMVILETKGYSDHLFVPQDSDLTEWTFHCVEGDTYYLSTEVDGEEKYLVIRNGYAGLGSSQEEASQIRVIPGKGADSGFFSFSSDGSFLTVTGEEGGRTFTGGGSDGKRWMKFAQKSSLTEDDYLIYTAKKISVSDPAQQVVLYTRVWNGTKYEFYAVDYDGSLIHCFDDGDVIKWVGNQYESAVWALTEHPDQNGYYELQNTYSGQYINPKLADGQLLSDSTANLNLDGRYYEEDYTKIRSWDHTYYSYIGMKVDLENNRVVPCPSAQADDFYFARVKTSQSHLTEVDTIDNDDFGISMRMIDFNNQIVRKRDSVQTEYFGYDSNREGLLTTDIGENGYPGTTNHASTLGTDVSLKDLFAGDYPVNHLFIQSVYDESGYFEFNSTKNYAYLNPVDKAFEVYDQLGTVEREGTFQITMKHGQFMPYNSLINPATGEPWPYSEKNVNTTSVTATDLPTDDPRYGEGLHEIPESKADYFFGMEMSASFTQTPDGLDAWGHDIIFEFSGDDDFWLYVDGELILDLGGVHTAMTGSVNFRTGVVTGRNGTQKTLRQIMERNYRSRNPGATSEEVAEYLLRFFDEGSTVFRDYSSHQMKVYYMERGAGASNLYMRFNLTAVKPGEVTLSKKVTGSDDIDYELMEFPYQIWYLTRGNSGNGEEGENLYERLTQDEEHPAVTYKGSKRPVRFAVSFTPVGGMESYVDVFFLKPGETASINLPEDVVAYKIVECGVNRNIFKSVSANGEVLSQEGETGRHDYEIGYASIEDRPEVAFENEVDPDSLRTLTITKVLWDEHGYTEDTDGTKTGTRLEGYDADPTTFDFRLSLSAQDSGALAPARRKSYFVRDPENHYCRWDAASQKFVSLGITKYPALAEYIATLDDAGKAAVIFETSINGSASRIPGGYSMEFRGLPVDSSFGILEREDELPAGYTLAAYERDKGSYLSGDEPNQGTIRANEDPHILAHNRRGWGLTVRKVWSDADYMDLHDPIYFAVYLKEPSGGTAGGQTEYSLLEGSVREVASGDTSVYYFFDALKEGFSFADYVVSEVRLTEPVTAENGIVTRYGSIERIEEGGTISVGGKPKDGDYQEGFSYEVSYATGEATGGNENVREDTVTNTRAGIRLLKTDWNGTALPGATFTLKDGEGNTVGAETYTSDSEGRITIAYLDPGTYTLEETAHPGGFQNPSQPWTITKETDDTISVEGDEGSFEVIQALEGEMAVIKLKNKGFSLQALKVDGTAGGNGDKVLEGAVFALYRQVGAVSGLVKDQRPMAGYEALRTDENGVIPKITSALGAGTYYLTEVTPPGGYRQLAGDLVFTILPEGGVEIPSEVSSADPDTLIILNNLEDSGVKDWILTSAEENEEHVTYTIRIPNELEGVPIRIVKTDQGDKPLEGARFYFVGKDFDGEEQDLEDPTVYVSTISDGEEPEAAVILERQAVPLGTYVLHESGVPEGFLMLEEDLVVKVQLVEGEILVGAAIGEKEIPYPKVRKNQDTGVWTIKVTNQTGYKLPGTGSAITPTHLYLLAGVLMLVSLLGLWSRQGNSR